MQNTTKTQAARAGELIPDIKLGIDCTDRELIGTAAGRMFYKVSEIPDLIAANLDQGDIVTARHLSELLVYQVEEWVVDEARVVPSARELEEILRDLDPTW